MLPSVITPLRRAHSVVPLLLAAILLASGALKALQLASTPVFKAGIWDSRWLSFVAIQAEAVVGALMLAGLYPRHTRRAAIALFATFGVIALAKILSGESHCGCFGSVEVSPWFALAFDVIAVTALCNWRPRTERAATDRRFSAVRPSRLAFVILVALVAFAGAMQKPTLQTIGDNGTIDADGGIVVLEPRDWIGRRFPLLPHIDIAQELEHGSWTVILYQHECPKCQAVLARFHNSTPRLAFVELPPYSTVEDPNADPFIAGDRGRLTTPFEVFGELPIIVGLSDGIVEVAQQGDTARSHGVLTGMLRTRFASSLFLPTSKEATP